MIRYIRPLAFLATASLSLQTSANFIEDWDDGNGATRWSAPIVAQQNAAIAFDGNVDYAFDYSSIGAASAPNSSGGTTMGVALQTNLTDQCPGDPDCSGSAEGEAVGIVPLSALGNIPVGDFTFRTDMYIYLNGVGGTTEYATVGVFSQGAAVPLSLGGDSGDGLAWSVNSDGDSATDIFRFENPVGLETGLGGYEDIPDGSIPGVPTGAASQVGPFNQWVELEISSVAGWVSFLMNGYLLDVVDNSAGTFNGGTLMLGQFDPFSSVNLGGIGASNMVVFDNVSLVVGSDQSIPEPATLALLLPASVVLIGLRRRSPRIAVA
jgi:hypothetical protein